MLRSYRTATLTRGTCGEGVREASVQNTEIRQEALNDEGKDGMESGSVVAIIRLANLFQIFNTKVSRGKDDRDSSCSFIRAVIQEVTQRWTAKANVPSCAKVLQARIVTSRDHMRGVGLRSVGYLGKGAYRSVHCRHSWWK